MSSSQYNRLVSFVAGSLRYAALTLLALIILPVIMGSSSNYSIEYKLNNMGFFREGYDAKTGKWINKKPSQYAFPISPDTYQRVKNWYTTDSGTKNPDNLEIEAPREGYTYIYTPYRDPKHPEAIGMSSMGLQGFKGYWYADDLSKATDSVTSKGDIMSITPPKDNSPAVVKFGGYDARTGNWVNTTPGDDAFPVSYVTYNRIKNWYATDFGANNPLGLPIEIPREDYTYLYVPFNDPKHPGVVGMSFSGDNAYRGYWYADKIGVTNDTIVVKPNAQNATQAVPTSNQPLPPKQIKDDVK